jgi:hypothetical protein
MAGAVAVALRAVVLSAGLVLLSPSVTRAAPTDDVGAHMPWLKSSAQTLTTATSRLRGLAGELTPDLGTSKAGQYDWHGQTKWLQDAASRCETLARQMDEAARKGQDSPQIKQLQSKFPNLRKTLLSESEANARKAAGAVKARQDKATDAIRGINAQ